ncbi:hypothetical protein [Motiliproteus sp. MSK22-1]|uniref:hypothetical protein n=1 Tax=Motiliproteus sp. MSK22-1 TaxID=1897630 RepID=UPI0009780037|nr:hypothetical protein [Motiliproteus sp. MSK22-1]OMH36546.1 hypothetical protein BGP75_09310 [Motiliproteus sp. MSK22-1]
MEVVGPLWGVVLAALFLTCILFVAFGQITVRKLRKNQRTKDQLGLELASGWDILNVAQALALPKALTDRFKESYLSAMFANADLLREHTSVFDRALAALFFWLYTFTGISLMLLTAHYFIFIE